MIRALLAFPYSLLTLVNRPLTKKIIVLVAIAAVILVGIRMMNGKKAPAPAPSTSAD